MRVVVVALDRCLGSGLIGLADILASANQTLRLMGRTESMLEVVVASQDGRPVLDGAGRRHEVDASLQELDECTAAIVPGFMPDEAGRLPAMSDYSIAANWLRARHRHGALVAGSCSGVFVLGEAGLLNDLKCTTTWWLHDQLAQVCPKANIMRGAPLTEENRIVTVGGPVSWIDIALHVIGKVAGADAARAAADFAIVDTTPSAQAAYIPTGFSLTGDPFVGEAERIVRHAGERGMTARLLAQELKVSERTLHRRLSNACGETPKDFIDRVRLETAKISLETTSKSIREVAQNVGYGDEASFRRSFKRVFGLTPGAYRSTIGRNR